MFRKLTSAAIQFLCLLWACDSGGFRTHPDQIPTKLAFTLEPTAAVEGAATSMVAVTVQDVYGNTVSSASTNVTVALGTNPASGTLSGTTTVAAVSGVAIFSNLILDKSGARYTLTASAAGLTGTTSSPFDVAPVPRKLAFVVQPSRTLINAAIKPAVQVAVEDENGNTMAGASTNVTLAIGTNPVGGTLWGTTTVAAVSGVAVFSNLILDKQGMGYTLTANAAGLTGTTSSPFDVVPPRLAFVVQPSTTFVSVAIKPAVQVAVEDENGNTMAGASTSITVAIGTNPAGGTLSGTTTVAAVSGVAVFSNLILDTKGVGYTLTANAAGLTGATSGPFEVVGASSTPGCLNLSSPIPFGLQTIGTSTATRALTLTNTCAGVAEDLSGGVAIDGYNSQDWSFGSNCPPVLGPGANCTFDVTFRPTGPGDRVGYFIVNQDLPNVVDVTLEGTAIVALAVSVAPDPSGASGGFVYVANANAGSVSMYRVDRATGVLAHLAPPAIPAGTNPVSVAVDPSGKFAYAANAGSNSVSMYTIDADGVLASIGPPVVAGTLPVSVAVAPDPAGGLGRFAYVANARSNDVSMYRIDPVTGALAWLGTMAMDSEPWVVAAHPSGKFAYVASPNGVDVAGNIDYINSAVYAYSIDNVTGVLTPAGLTITSSKFPSSLAVDASGRFAALANQGSGDMDVWNIDQAGALLTGPRLYLADQTAISLAISVRPSGKPFAYVTYGSGFFASQAGSHDNSVLTYDIEQGPASGLAGAAAAGVSPTSIAIDPSGRFAYVANSGSSDVSMYGINADGTLAPLVPGTIGL